MHFWMKYNIFRFYYFNFIPEGDTTTVHFPLSTINWSEAQTTIYRCDLYILHYTAGWGHCQNIYFPSETPGRGCAMEKAGV